MKKIAAPRANHPPGSGCTGPRTAVGKRRSSANSFKHGLSRPAKFSAEDRQLIEELAAAIAGKEADVLRLSAARKLAESEMDIVRLERSKASLVGSQFAKSELVVRNDGAAEQRSQGLACLQALASLERYEARIWWQYKRSLCHWLLVSGQ